jgi:dipeptidyl aminopeptidase/acylaminoacyl peptidase
MTSSKLVFLSSLFCASTMLSTAALATESATVQQRGFTVEDMVKMERISKPVLSPDGKQVIYQLRRADLVKNRGLTDLMLLALDGDAKAAPLHLTQDSSKPDANNTSPEWSADGKSVYFISTRSGSAQVWRRGLNASNPDPAIEALPSMVQITDLPLPVESFRVSPSQDRIAVSLEVFRDCADLACSKQRLDKIEKQQASGRTYQQLFVRHWDSWADGRRLVLFSAPLAASGRVSGEPVSLSGTLDADVHSKPDGDQSDYQFSPDGKSIVFAARVAGKAEAWSTNFDLYQVPAVGGLAPKNLTADNLAWDAKPSFSPDGRTLAYLAMKRPGFEADRFQMVLLDLASGKKRLLAEKWDRSVQEFSWEQDSKSLYVAAEELGQRKLFSIDATSSTVRTLTGLGEVTGFDVQGNSLVIAQNNLANSSQLFTAKLEQLDKPGKLNKGGNAHNGKAGWQQVTHVNTELLKEVKFGEYQQFSFKGAKGDTVHGYVMQPWNAKAGEKYPIAFLVHGGPQGSFGNSWGYRWNPQTYAGAGYGVVFIDFHGSTGYGQAFTDSISGDWGGAPLEDLKKGMAAATQQFPWLDRSKACALGASYGGYMMNWIQGNWSDGFQCIVAHAGVFDTRSMYYSTEELWFNEWENGGTYYDAAAKHEKFNPVNHVKKWKTPMLVIQGELDFRIPTAQSLGSFTALQRRGIDSKLLVFPDENHHILKPANSVLWHHTVNDWLQQHLQK